MTAPARTLPATARLSALVVVNAVTGAVCVLAGLALAIDSGGGARAVAAGIACAAVGLVAGQAAFLLHRRRRGGRLLQVGLAVLGLPFLPFWTIASAWTLATMFRRAERTLLSGRLEKGRTPEEAVSASSLPAPPKGRAVLLASGLLLLAALEGAFLATLPARGSLERSRQQQTMARMRSAMTAIESFAAKEGAYPPTSSMDDLAKLLEPAHVERLPRVDAWGHPLRYEAWKGDGEGARSDAYFLASPGKDGAWQVPDARTAPPGASRGPAADIVIRNGVFVSGPEGALTPSERGAGSAAAR